MKIVDQLLEAVLRLGEAQREVDRLKLELRRKTDGRGKRGADRKPRKKRVAKAE